MNLPTSGCQVRNSNLTLPIGTLNQNGLPTLVPLSSTPQITEIPCKDADGDNTPNSPSGTVRHLQQSRIFVTDYDGNRVISYTKDGKNGKVICAVQKPRSLALSDDGRYLFIGCDNSLYKMIMEGEIVAEMINQFQCLTSLFYKNGRLVVVEEDAQTVMIFSDSLKLENQKSFGFKTCYAERGLSGVYVSDCGTGELLVLDWSLDEVAHIKLKTKICGLSMDGDGNLCVSGKGGIYVYGPDYQLLKFIDMGSGDREFSNLHQTPEGDFVVSDPDNHRCLFVKLQEIC